MRQRRARGRGRPIRSSRSRLVASLCPFSPSMKSVTREPPFSLEQSYRQRTLTVGTSHLLVQRAIRGPGHCAIDGDVREQAFDELIAWIERGVKPDGDGPSAAADTERSTQGREVAWQITD